MNSFLWVLIHSLSWPKSSSPKMFLLKFDIFWYFRSGVKMNLSPLSCISLTRSKKSLSSLALIWCPLGWSIPSSVSIFLKISSRADIASLHRCIDFCVTLTPRHFIISFKRLFKCFSLRSKEILCPFPRLLLTVLFHLSKWQSLLDERHVEKKNGCNAANAYLVCL